MAPAAGASAPSLASVSAFSPAGLLPPQAASEATSASGSTARKMCVFIGSIFRDRGDGAGQALEAGAGIVPGGERVDRGGAGFR